MFSLSLSTLRHRRGGVGGGLVGRGLAAGLVPAGGRRMGAGLRSHVAPERYAAAPIIVSGDPDAHLVKDDGDRKSKPNTARGRIAASLTGRVQAVSGVRSVVPEVTVPAVIGGSPVDGHGWESAGLAGSVL